VAELPGARAGRERGRESSTKGANEQGELGERGAGSKGAESMLWWPENAQMWARPRRGRGQEVRDGV
jgi:hypothetical protein